MNKLPALIAALIALAAGSALAADEKKPDAMAAPAMSTDAMKPAHRDTMGKTAKHASTGGMKHGAGKAKADPMKGDAMKGDAMKGDAMKGDAMKK